MHAEVGEDAKLDFIDIDDSQTANIDLGGSGRSFGPVSLTTPGCIAPESRCRGVPTDRTRHGAVDIAFTERGITFGRSQLGQGGAAIARTLDRAFAELVATEIANFQTSRPAGTSRTSA